MPTVPGLETLINDVRSGIRTLARTPLFTAAALLTLGLGIGANTAIFTVVNAVMIRPLPYPEPDRLVQLVRRFPSDAGTRLDGRRYLFFREHLRSVDALAAYAGLGSANLVHGDAGQIVRMSGISKEYFQVFGVRPAIGHAFTAEHDVSGGPDVAILSHALWQRTFGSDPGIVGRSVSLGDKPFTVIGIMPLSFEPPSQTDLFLPLRPGLTGRGGGYNYAVVGRLTNGVSLVQASVEAASVWMAFAEQFPRSVMRGETPSGFLVLQETLALPVKPALLVLSAAAGLLLLIACANTANLLLARASGRGREMALRAALGASRARIVRQVLVESVLLSIAGACVGVTLAHWIVPVLLAITPPGYLVVEQIQVDRVVLAAATLVALVTGILFGLAPALSASKRNPIDALRNDSTRLTGSRGTGWLRHVLVIGQFAVCMLLLVGAGLMIRTFMNLRALDPGFDPRGILTTRMSLQGERYSTPEAVNRLYEEGLQRIRSIPGVNAAAVVSGLPLEPALNLNVDVLDGAVDEQVSNALTDWRYATAGYFETLGIPIVAGRGFTNADRAGAPPVAVVSETFARRILKGRALGRHIRIFDADGSMEVVGIVADLREGGLRGPVPAVMYVPVAQTHATAIMTTHSYFHVSWVVRTAGINARLARQIEHEVGALDPRQPISAFRTMDEVKSRAMAAERFQMILLGCFAGIGLLLASAGIYGLVAYTVAQRTREFGIRMALGASNGRILGAVLRQSALLTLAGVVVGGAASILATRALRSFVWGVSTTDAATFAIVPVLLALVAIAASLVPAVRAVRLNPIRALRE